MHINQYGFLQDRSIQDCLAWDFEYLHQCLQSNREMVNLKLGFEKAFNLIEHNLFFDILDAKGFEHTWINSIKMSFGSGTFLCSFKWHSQQGDPVQNGSKTRDHLSPFIFVLESDFLLSILNEAMPNSITQAPLPMTSCPGFLVYSLCR